MQLPPHRVRIIVPRRAVEIASLIHDQAGDGPLAIFSTLEGMEIGFGTVRRKLENSTASIIVAAARAGAIKMGRSVDFPVSMIRPALGLPPPCLRPRPPGKV